MAKAKEEQGEVRSVEPRAVAETEPWQTLLTEWPWRARIPRVLEELFRDAPWGREGGPLVPALDVTENDAQYTISVEIPGVEKKDVHVELQERVLTIRGEKRSEREEKKEQSRYAERSYGTFRRSFRLPADADAAHLDASFENGVLSITIPRTQEAKPRTIAIKAG